MEGRSLFSQVSPVRLLVCTLPAALAATIGCAGLLNTKKVLHTDSQGSVALEEVVDWSFEASHPSLLDPAVLARALQGIRTSSNAETSVYAPADISYLAPLLSNALSKAKAEHVVAFHLTSESARQVGITGGTLYVKGSSLYLTPVPAQASRSGSSFFGRSRPVPAAEVPQDLTFEPRSLARTHKAASELAEGYSHLTSFAIDHWTLAKLPAPLPVSAKVAAPVSVPAAAAAFPPPSIPVASSAVPSESIAPTTAKTEATDQISRSSRPSQAKAPDSPAKPTSERRIQSRAAQKPVPPKKAAPKATLRPAPPKASEPSKDHAAILDVLKKGTVPESTKPAQ